MLEVFGTVDCREEFLWTVVRAFRVHTRSLVVDACLVGKRCSGDMVVQADEEEAPVQLHHFVLAVAPSHRKGPSSYLRFVEWCDRGSGCCPLFPAFLMLSLVTRLDIL